MSREERAAISEPNLLLVEGDDDRRFFRALAQHLGLAEIAIRTMGGTGNLGDRVEAISAEPGFKDTVRTFGVVRDADENPAGAFQSVCDALRAADLPVPKRCGEPCGRAPRVSVMILPSQSETGSLEDVLLASVRDDLAAPCIDGYFDCLKEKGLPAPRQESKARVTAFLASRERAHRLLGEAADAGVWPWGSPAFTPLKEFLRGPFAAAC